MLQLVDLGGDLFSFSEGDGESVHLDEDVAQELGGLLGDGIAGKEDVVLLGPFLDFGLIFIKSLEAVNVDVGNVVGCGLLDVGSVGKDANLSGMNVTLMLL